MPHTARAKDEFGRTAMHVVFDDEWWRIGSLTRVGSEDDDPERGRWVARRNDGTPLAREDVTRTFRTVGDGVAGLWEVHQAQGSPRPAP